MEDGAFQSFNKVESPFDIRVTLTRGGSSANRTAFLDAILGLKKSLDLYDIVTPDKTYINVNLENYSYRRTSRSGKTLITAELFFKEIRITTSDSGYSPAAPSGALPSIGGMVSGVVAGVQSAVNTITSTVSSVAGAVSGLTSVVTGSNSLLSSASAAGLPTSTSGLLASIGATVPGIPSVPGIPPLSDMVNL